MSSYFVAALYKFVRLAGFEALQPRLLAEAKRLDIRGTLLLADEGINGTVAGSEQNIYALINWLKAIPELADLEYKTSWASEPPFYRMKVKLKREIVTMGVPGIDPNKVVGTYVKPKDWNALISRNDVVLIDTRNDYEVEIGTFKGAVNPNIKTFREFPEWAQEQQGLQNRPSVAMFCTGGIRCEKSTALFKEWGFENVYHLEGGILKYLEEVDPAESLWEGDCFVFDERVAVSHGLEEAHYELCRACRRPVTEDDKAHADFEDGVSCPRCVNETTLAQRSSFRERQHQSSLAAERGEKHVGRQR